MKWIILTIVAVALISAGVYLSSKNKSPEKETLVSTPTPTTIEPTEAATVSGTITPSAMQSDKLLIVDLKVGTGAEAVAGKTVTVNYKGTLTNGTEFDSSYKRNQPFVFDLGAGSVIKGWDQGVVGMKVGGKRKLTIPASLGYGAIANGPIPANSTLIFEIELLKVE